MFTPLLQEECLVLGDEPLETSEFRRAKAEVASERNRFQPELRGLFVAVHVNMRRLVRFVAVEIHAVGTVPPRRSAGF